MEQPGSVQAEAPLILRDARFDQVVKDYVQHPDKYSRDATMALLDGMATQSEQHGPVDVLHSLEDMHGQYATQLTAEASKGRDSRRGRHAVAQKTRFVEGLEDLIGAYVHRKNEESGGNNLPQLTIDSLKRMAEARERSAPSDIGRVAKSIRWIMAGPDQKGVAGIKAAYDERGAAGVVGWLGRQVTKGLATGLQYATNTEVHKRDWAKWVNFGVKGGAAIAGVLLAPVAAAVAGTLAGFRTLADRPMQVGIAGGMGRRAALKQGAVADTLGSLQPETYNPDEHGDVSTFLQSWRSKAVGQVAGQAMQARETAKEAKRTELDNQRGWAKFRKIGGRMAVSMATGGTVGHFVRGLPSAADYLGHNPGGVDTVAQTAGSADQAVPVSPVSYDHAISIEPHGITDGALGPKIDIDPSIDPNGALDSDTISAVIAEDFKDDIKKAMLENALSQQGGTPVDPAAVFRKSFMDYWHQHPDFQDAMAKLIPQQQADVLQAVDQGLDTKLAGQFGYNPDSTSVATYQEWMGLDPLAKAAQNADSAAAEADRLAAEAMHTDPTKVNLAKTDGGVYLWNIADKLGANMDKFFHDLNALKTDNGLDFQYGSGKSVEYGAHFNHDTVVVPVDENGVPHPENAMAYKAGDILNKDDLAVLVKAKQAGAKFMSSDEFIKTSSAPTPEDGVPVVSTTGGDIIVAAGQGRNAATEIINSMSGQGQETTISIDSAGYDQAVTDYLQAHKDMVAAMSPNEQQAFFRGLDSGLDAWGGKVRGYSVEGTTWEHIRDLWNQVPGSGQESVPGGGQGAEALQRAHDMAETLRKEAATAAGNADPTKADLAIEDGGISLWQMAKHPDKLWDNLHSLDDQGYVDVKFGGNGPKENWWMEWPTTTKKDFVLVQVDASGKPIPGTEIYYQPGTILGKSDAATISDRLADGYKMMSPDEVWPTTPSGGSGDSVIFSMPDGDGSDAVPGTPGGGDTVVTPPDGSSEIPGTPGGGEVPDAQGGGRGTDVVIAGTPQEQQATFVGDAFGKTRAIMANELLGSVNNGGSSAPNADALLEQSFKTYLEQNPGARAYLESLSTEQRLSVLTRLDQQLDSQVAGTFPGYNPASTSAQDYDNWFHEVSGQQPEFGGDVDMGQVVGSAAAAIPPTSQAGQLVQAISARFSGLIGGDPSLSGDTLPQRLTEYLNSEDFLPQRDYVLAHWGDGEVEDAIMQSVMSGASAAAGWTIIETINDWVEQVRKQQEQELVGAGSSAGL